MTATSGFDPVFVHASARSGSTYVFSVLRRNHSLMCFNEAIIDGKRDYAAFKSASDRNSDRVGVQKWDVNHHFLDREDYVEFLDAWDEVMHLCPEFPEFEGYLPSDGVLRSELVAYLSGLMNYARLRNKRPVLCEINSLGRAGALRATFGGYHVAQYRNPLSQFGSYVRALVDGGTWGFLSHPVTELGVNCQHPLYRLVPEQWRAPNFPWRTETRASRWGSDARYVALTASTRSETVERLFRWHMFSWLLNNLAALSYSDLGLDIDKAHDDAAYRASIVATLAAETGATPDFSDIGKFDRYYEFESFDMAGVGDQVVSAARSALRDGRLEAAVRTLGIEPLVTSTEAAAELLLAKIREALASMSSSAARRRISAAEWTELAVKNRKLWHQPAFRWMAEHLYPLAAPVGRIVRRAGIPI
jgi:hypothetical protein